MDVQNVVLFDIQKDSNRFLLQYLGLVHLLE